MYSEIPLSPLPKLYYQEPMIIDNVKLYEHYKYLITEFHDELYMLLFLIFYFLSIIQTGKFIKMKEMYNHSQKEKQAYAQRIKYLEDLINAHKDLTATILANNNETFYYCTSCSKCEKYENFLSFTSTSEEFDQYYNLYTTSISENNNTVVENITDSSKSYL